VAYFTLGSKNIKSDLAYTAGVERGGDRDGGKREGGAWGLPVSLF